MEKVIIDAVTKAVNAMSDSQVHTLVTDAYMGALAEHPKPMDLLLTGQTTCYGSWATGRIYKLERMRNRKNCPPELFRGTALVGTGFRDLPAS